MQRGDAQAMKKGRRVNNGTWLKSAGEPSHRREGNSGRSLPPMTALQ